MLRRFTILVVRRPLSISIESILEIVEQSAFLEERLGGDFLPETRAEDSEVIDKRMEAWRRNCARSDERVFRKRLEWTAWMWSAPNLLWGESGG